MVFRVLFLLLPFFLFGKVMFQEPWGKDSDLIQKRKKEIPKKSFNPAMKTAHSIIRFHQNFLSPTTGPRSSYRPTSSRYMELAIERYGFIRGFLMGCDRLLRENSEEWVYRTVEIEGKTYKYDPAWVDKYLIDP